MAKNWNKSFNQLGASSYMLLFALAAVMLIPAMGSAFAQEDLTVIGPNMAIQKSTLEMSIPENNSLPWAFVEGKIDNAVTDYPVIIQIYDNDSQVSGNIAGGVHFAQTSVADDGTYQYKFRVLDGNQANFAGDYTVKIFKVVYLDSLSSA